MYYILDPTPITVDGVPLLEVRVHITAGSFNKGPARIKDALDLMDKLERNVNRMGIFYPENILKATLLECESYDPNNK